MPIVYEVSGEAHIVPGSGSSRPARIAKEIQKLALKLKAKGVTDFEDPFAPTSFDKPVSTYITLPIARLRLDLHGRNPNGTLKQQEQQQTIADTSDITTIDFAQRLDYTFLQAKAEEAAALAAVQAAAAMERERQQHSLRHHYPSYYMRTVGNSIVGAAGQHSHRSSGSDPPQASAEMEEMSARIASAAFSAQQILVHDDDPDGEMLQPAESHDPHDSSPGRRAPCLSRMLQWQTSGHWDGAGAPNARTEASAFKHRTDRYIEQHSLRWDALPGGFLAAQAEHSLSGTFPDSTNPQVASS